MSELSCIKVLLYSRVLVLAYLRSFYWRKSLIYGFRLILTQKFPLKSMVFF